MLLPLAHEDEDEVEELAIASSRGIALLSEAADLTSPSPPPPPSSLAPLPFEPDFNKEDDEEGCGGGEGASIKHRRPGIRARNGSKSFPKRTSR